MKLHFNTLAYQKEAVDSIVSLFAGEAPLAQRYSQEYGDLISASVANHLSVSPDQILQNLQAVQNRNAIAPSEDLAQRQFCITMETGTGKTYVYTKSIYELNAYYGFTKFIIVVPSVAIREGVQKSLEITHDHFQTHYGKKPIRWFVYNSSRLSDVREFAHSTDIEVMIINIDAFRKSENIINQPMDRMNGDRPIDLIANVCPIVIIDEPQSVTNTAKAKEAISWLNPLFELRFSATHREEVNPIYNLSPIDAYEQGLVKQISVSSLSTQDNFNQPYLRLVKVDHSNGYKARIELDVKKADGTIARTTKTVKVGEDLYLLSGEREQYRDWQITDIDCLEGYENIEMNGSRSLALGQAIGDVSEKDIRRGQIRKTIEHHLDKELQLLPRGIKVLSLFFLDRVENYRVYGENATQRSEYARIFEEEYNSLIQLQKYQSLQQFLPYFTEAERAHDGYFSKDKKGKLKDTRGDTADDQSTYALIMKDKEKLLSMKTPLRFIFSHSALREGWDNPNVFQVCTLLEQSSALSARQRIGRGLRLCVDQTGERIYDKEINCLHIIATESFAEFADKLQREIENETGVKFGVIDISTFIAMEIPVSAAQSLGVDVPQDVQADYERWQQDLSTPAPVAHDEPTVGEENDIALPEFQPPARTEPRVRLGSEQAAKLLSVLVAQNVLDQKGKLTKAAQEKIRSDSLSEMLPAAYQPIANPIIAEIRKADRRVPLRDVSKEVKIKLKKHVLENAEFLAIWEKISQKTRYRVQLDQEKFLAEIKEKLKALPPIEKPKIEEITATIDVNKQGVEAEQQQVRLFQLDQALTTIPDLMTMLTQENKITPRTLWALLKELKFEHGLLNNPEKFIEQMHLLIKQAKAAMLTQGIRYTKIHGETYAAQELFDKEELTAYLERSVETSRSVYDRVKVDSDVESAFAQDLEKDPDVRFFFKLPEKFKIDTPFGGYNPDWAVLLNEYGTDKLYLVIETKGSVQEWQRRVSENAKIQCARQHFAELGAVTYKDADSWKQAKPAA
ncbi:DEAD/DEAH box helicase family protein [Bartonella rattaustraliani]|uniref:restriction endonuclease n=1 Tax=Bartonella rattaustraliani TaxID=481139 RepID=UPI0002ED3341|nr:DEAD/DEAH box helicase family protein [Bartonella rattaustraliani]